MKKKNIIALIAAFVVFIIILMLPNPESLPFAGQVSLAVLAFAVIIWVTEAVSYPVSAVMIVSFIALFVGLSPTIEDPSVTYGTKGALGMAISGFSSTAVLLVAGALVLAAAMEITGLHKRIALFIMSKVGTKPRNLVIGVIVVTFILALIVPSATARAGALIPILLGIIAAFGMAKNSKLAALLMITAVQAISIWNIGIKTAAAQNMVALGFMETQWGFDISWGKWFLYAAPWSIIMSIVLYFVITRLIKVEDMPGNAGTESIKAQLKDLGKIHGKELRLIIISATLLILWATEGILHPFDSTTVTIFAVAIMLTPGIGIFTWKEVQPKVPWGTLIVFATGISLGTVLLNTEGATWLSSNTFEAMGLTDMPLVVMIAVLALFNILIHLGFASATSLAAAFIPIVIALVVGMGETAFNGPGLVLIMQFVISFGFLLPVSAPQNMLAYGTNTFSAKQFLKAGIPITIIGYLLIVLFSATYWQWIGLL
ncbi:DASS family sodium-coupled anion symporter [Oceanobacillus halophilus]|uniref:DASS family sodium-coupled anion symporter n=1 Tax=Oceanobacillus halophilus TaxID=930130 RepID=A0A495A3X8_9BACI|nr:DASS family sodium-coupled anion symporter [Oceanobacillus halophilus]RKQ34256.1 DASS family sodium-coupled anion symporter [Oceanobacillus halophilus]